MREYTLIDCTERYKSVMQFDKNKNVSVHRWYPFVEGYSKEFIEDILDELPFIPQCALEPFSGSGTTPVELQNHQVRCYSFEVSPFMHLLAMVKLERSYSIHELERYISQVENCLKNCPADIRRFEPIPFGNTIVKKEGLSKWNFHDTALDGLLDIRYAIRHSITDERYNSLFTIAFASIILKASNLFRNGKCLSYKKGWQERKYSRKQVHELFLERLKTVITEDIRILASNPNVINNLEICCFGDVRSHIGEIADESLDLIITSPPYLNSRDYTDIYMLELKVLQLVNSHEELRELRKNTLRSHVQVSYEEVMPINNERLHKCLEKMCDRDKKRWNSNILNMICGYFEDMQLLFSAFSHKMRRGGKIYFNVANSSYFGIEIPVDYIIGDIAEGYGFHVQEIRKARDLKTSPQQGKLLGKLRESVLVMEKL